MRYKIWISKDYQTRATPLGPNSLFNFQCLLIYSSLHYTYSIQLIYFHLIMMFWKHRNVVPCFIIFYRRLLLSDAKSQWKLTFPNVMLNSTIIIMFISFLRKHWQMRCKKSWVFLEVLLVRQKWRWTTSNFNKHLKSSFLGFDVV